MSQNGLSITGSNYSSWIANTPSPEELHWATEVLHRLAQHVSLSPNKPCDYAPWTQAFQEIRVEPSLITGLARKLSRRRWHDHQFAMAEFAITYLEVDVMLFQSGYDKAKLIRRIGQTNLTPVQLERVQSLLKGAVLKGAGREEFIAYCKLAAKIMPSGLRYWLHNYAKDAVVIVEGDSQRTQVSWEDLTKDGIYQLLSGRLNWWARDGHNGTEYLMVKADRRLRTPDQQIARNALYMLLRVEAGLAQGENLALPLDIPSNE